MGGPAAVSGADAAVDAAGELAGVSAAAVLEAAPATVMSVLGVADASGVAGLVAGRPELSGATAVAWVSAVFSAAEGGIAEKGTYSPDGAESLQPAMITAAILVRKISSRFTGKAPSLQSGKAIRSRGIRSPNNCILPACGVQAYPHPPGKCGIQRGEENWLVRFGTHSDLLACVDSSICLLSDRQATSGKAAADGSVPTCGRS